MGTGTNAYVALVTGIENWGDLDPATEPSAREGPSMAYDSTRDVVILFGGYNGSHLSDTWEYDYAANIWTELSTTGAPSGREYSSLAYDSGNDVFVLFGGYPGPLADTWEYDPGTQTWTETTPGFSPGTMYSYALVYDSSAARVVLGAEGFFSGSFETWAYDASLDSWTQMSPVDDPGPRSDHSLTYMPSIGRTVLFGGVEGLTFLSDVWEYDYSGDSWEKMFPGSGPSARFGHEAAYRTFDQSIVVYGGFEDGGAYPTDTWKYEYISGSETWNHVMTINNPGSRNQAALAYLPNDNSTIVFGGNDGFSNVNDTWELAAFYTSMGFFTSSAFDSLYTDTEYTSIWWNWTPGNQPPNTQLWFQIRVSNNSAGPWTNFVGPDGTGFSYFTTPGEAISAGTIGRYFKYTATLMTSDGLDTPRMYDVTIVYTLPTLDPVIAWTIPFSTQFDVLLWQNITVLFSEPMATGTLTWIINPSPGPWTEEWDSTDTLLYLNHSNPFAEKTVYIAHITYIEDKTGNALVGGTEPNPWAFTTIAIAPYIDETEPANNDIDVPLDYPIWINFSEPMDTPTVTWTIGPDPGGWTEQWQNGDQTLYLTHSTDYGQCLQYTVEVTAGKDLKGTDLVPGVAPNPWRFNTVCLDPFIMATDPADGQIDVPLDYPITVDFSKEVDNGTFLWTITPDPGGWSENWAPQNLSVVLDHSVLFTECTGYNVSVDYVEDLGGGTLIPGPVVNPWTFNTICPNPQIVTTDPQDGAQDVPTYKNITVTFSKTVDPATFTRTITPDPGSWTETWMLSDTVVLLEHTTLFGQCTDYTVNVTYVADLSGNPLIPGPVPNPWSFNTSCFSPVILSTYPENNTFDIPLTAPIIINFSKAMNKTSFLWSIGPTDPGGWASASWSNGDKTVTLTHSNLYTDATRYVVAVTFAEDTDGNLLVAGPAPNPWEFTTTSANPYIMLTDPIHGTINVALDYNITITFSEPMNPPTVTWTIDPNPGGWSTTWLMGDTVLVLNHSNPFAECLQHTFNVTGGLDMQGLPLVPGPVSNPFNFRPVCFSPIITDTHPVNGTINFPVDGDLWINFSEPMDTFTVGWTVNPFVGHQPTWFNNNQTLRLDHPLDYDEGQLYEVTITGDDMDGNKLVPGPVPNPFYFTTVSQNPYIVSTDPYDGETGVGVNAPIVITFSEEMDTATVTWTIDPNPGGWTETWESNNTVLNLTHANPFASMTTYTVEVLTGNDTSGLPLIPGPVQNPWSFTTESVNPYITATSPADGDTNVPRDKSIVIDFNKEIDILTFQWTITPNPGGWSKTWSNGNMTVTLDHTNLFDPLMLHNVTVTAADDMDGNPLVPGPVPNPWIFTTGAVVEPYIVDTYPADNATGVSVTSSIWINFSEAIDVPTFAWNIDPIIPGAVWMESWTNGNMTVELSHDLPFAENTVYTVTVTAADDLDGNPLIPGPVPNPWSFTTEIVAPWIVDTYPPNGTIGVPLDAPIIVNFSEPMDPASLIYSVVPDPGGWTATWTNGNMTLTLTHSNPYAECTPYTVTISAQDLQGQPLVVGPASNPWSFTTVCINPYITVTDPADLEADVPLDYDITITFSEQIDTPTFAWNIAPGLGNWTDVWSGGNTIVTLSHAIPFDVCQMYTVTVTAADDMDGYPLVAGPVLNPWSFDTICPITPPSGLTVSRVFPSDVRLDWNVVPGATVYNVYHSMGRFAAFPAGWTMTNTVNNFILFPHLDDNTTHYYVVRAYSNVSGESTNSTMGVKIHKAFAFNPIQMNIYWMSLPYVSEYATAGDIATELTETNINVIAKWDRASQTIISYYYARGKWRGRDFTLSAGDGFYVSVVKDFNWFIVGTDAEITIDLPYSPQPFKHNKHYISVPYTGAYTLASDIVVDIEGGLGPGTNTHTIEVGLWDAASQSERTYTYTPTGWAGDNFLISPGDGVYIRMVATFNWQPILLTPEVP
ncbi:MAG: Ig-like domain-containing protein [Thermoplasmata archaeon]|nr:Ig-like domain-containing protein [Thermoplasmata archaeon]